MQFDVIVTLLLSSFCLFGTAHVLRKEPADFFTIPGECSPRTCLIESRGTSEMAHNLMTPDVVSEQTGCICKCVNHLPVFREDLRLCVHDIHECSLVPFLSGNRYQKVPYVYLPLKGQIVHPSAEIIFTGVKHPICVVSGANYLTVGGWVDLRNRSDHEPPFRLYVDEGRTFLQWLGESELRVSMEGRILLVNLLCKEIHDEDHQESNIFTPCLAFRTAGAPSDGSIWSGIREVSFSTDGQSVAGKKVDKGYILMAISSLILGIVYITATFAYLRSRQRKSYSNQKRRSAAVTEEHIVKRNPLLMHCHDSLVYLNESSPSPVDSDGASALPDDSIPPRVKITSALIHGVRDCSQGITNDQGNETGNMECIPEENVSIIDKIESRDEKFIQVVGTVNMRRKLYFNPAYFEPELLIAPPPGAIEFLEKIREVMSFAKAKMAAKRFLPSLMAIPEESCLTNNLDYSAWTSGQYSVTSSNGDLVTASTHSNIRRWLENIPYRRSQFQEYIYSSKSSKAYEEKLPDDELQLEIVDNLNEADIIPSLSADKDAHLVEKSASSLEEQSEETTHYEVIERNENVINTNSLKEFPEYTDLNVADLKIKNPYEKTFKNSDQSVTSNPEVPSHDHEYEMILMNKYNSDFNSLPDLTNLSEGYNHISDVSVKDKLSESVSLDNCSFDSKDGYLRITVEEYPVSKENDSDGIEPDTLDRKPIKFRVNDDTVAKRLIHEDFYFDSLERSVITLKTTGSFNTLAMNAKRKSLNRAFGSLREIFEAKNKYNHCAHKRSKRGQSQNTIYKSAYDRNILMPEERQAKRQRLPYPSLSIKPPCCHEILKDNASTSSNTHLIDEKNTKNGINEDINRVKAKPDQSKSQKFQAREDLGYLSTESNESRKNETPSDTDDSCYDGPSESGAESTATDSFFFGKFRKCSMLKAINIGGNSVAHCSDTDSNVSLITVLPY